MADNIGIAATLVLIVGIVWLIVAFIMKKNKRTPLIVLGVSFVVMVIAAIFAPPAPEKEKATAKETIESTQKKESSSTKESSKESSAKKESSTKESSSTAETVTSSIEKKKEKKETKTSTKKKKENRSKFFIIDNLVKNSSAIGTETMTVDDYNGFAENAFTLEGAIYKFGLPSHVIGSDEGDETMEVTYPSNEDGISIDLVFEYKPGGFGDWILKDKSAVKTDGIGFSEYTSPE